MHRPRLSPALLISAALALPLPALGETAGDATPDAAAPAQRTELFERSREQEQILQRQLPASEQRELQGAGESFLALWLPALSEAEGTVILLPGYGQHADHPNVIAPLRNKLPAAGWNTLSLSLPDALNASARAPKATPDEATPADTDAPIDASEDAETASEPTTEAVTDSEAEPAEQPTRLPVEQSQMVHPAPTGDAEPAPAPDATEPEQAHAERIFARIDAAIAFAQAEQSAEIVLVGTGTGAYWAARYATERKPAALQRLALISLRAPTARSLAQAPAALPEIPTADFFYQNRTDEQAAATQRKLASQRLKRTDYRAVGLQALPADPQAQREQLLRRLRGWLKPTVF